MFWGFWGCRLFCTASGINKLLNPQKNQMSEVFCRNGLTLTPARVNPLKQIGGALLTAAAPMINPLMMGARADV